jgi:alkanesulfonate monooxygenase SsuD/methylene tetrahydromethanopterin reductase-like flavin-dependent oxidoreductase (luciferase family)
LKPQGSRADKFLQVLKRAWTDDIVKFKGGFYNIPASKIGPKPVQKPHSPIVLGGFNPKNFCTNNELCRLLATDCRSWNFRTVPTIYKWLNRRYEKGKQRPIKD